MSEKRWQFKKTSLTMGLVASMLVSIAVPLTTSKVYASDDHSNYVLADRSRAALDSFREDIEVWREIINEVVVDLNDQNITYNTFIKDIKKKLYGKRKKKTDGLFGILRKGFTAASSSDDLDAYLEVEIDMYKMIADNLFEVNDHNKIKILSNIINEALIPSEDNKDEESLLTNIYSNVEENRLTSHKLIKIFIHSYLKTTNLDPELKEKVISKTNKNLTTASKQLVLDHEYFGQESIVNSYISLSPFFESLQNMLETFKDIMTPHPLPPGPDSTDEINSKIEAVKRLNLLKAWTSSDMSISNFKGIDFQYVLPAVKYAIANPKEFTLSETIESVDNLNEFYHGKKYTFSIQISSFAYGMDKKTEVMELLLERINSDFSGFERFRGNDLNLLHPYTKVYLRKLLSNRGQIIESDLYFNIDDYKNYEKNEDVHKRYAYHLLRVENLRELMRDKSSNGENISKSLNEELLRHALIATDLRVTKSHSFKKLFNKNPQTQVSESFWKLEDREKYKINKTSTEKIISPNLAQTKLHIPAGIYKEDVNIIIQGFDEVTFHPLAVIYAPGKNVTITTKTLKSPWIDTSALNATPATSNGQYNALEGILFPTQGRDYTSSGHKKDSEKYYIKNATDLWSKEKRERKGIEGNKAGDISLTADLLIGDAPILVAVGGNGSNGVRGKTILSDENKTSKTFKIMNKDCNAVQSCHTTKVCYDRD